MNATCPRRVPLATMRAARASCAASSLAYRRFGRPAETPLVVLLHFRGNLDNWDPALTDALAAEREVVLADYPGVGSSTGATSGTIPETTRQMIAFSGRRYL